MYPVSFILARLNSLNEAVATTLHLSAWASFCEEPENQHIEPRAGPGEDWADHAPPVTEQARQKAERILATCDLDWLPQISEEALPRLGHCLAMQAIGSGVGLVDFRHEWPEDARHIPETFEINSSWEFHYWSVEEGKAVQAPF